MVEKAGLAPIKVCIFSPEEKLREGLAFYSQQAGYKVEQRFSEPQKLLEFISRSNTDHIVLIDVRRGAEPLKLVEELSAGGPLAMVALADAADVELGRMALLAGAQALLVDPAKPKDIGAAFAVAAYQQAKQSRLENEIQDLRDKLAQRKLIEIAKGILMDAAKVTESDAFTLIQKQSQDQRKPMAEIATSIITATELVKEAARARAE